MAYSTASIACQSLAGFVLLRIWVGNCYKELAQKQAEISKNDY